MKTITLTILFAVCLWAEDAPKVAEKPKPPTVEQLQQQIAEKDKVIAWYAQMLAKTEQKLQAALGLFNAQAAMDALGPVPTVTELKK